MRARFICIIAIALCTAMHSSSSPAYGANREEAWLKTPSNPLAGALPVISTRNLGDGLRLLPGGKNAFSLIMGAATPGANMLDSQSIRERFFLNYLSGDLHKAIGSPIDNGQANNNVFAAVARHYAVGDPDDLHVMAADGMHLRAICSNDRADCSPGHVWGAMVRLPFAWRPGTVFKIRYKTPKGNHSWTPIWMATGQQDPPPKGVDPYLDFGKPNALVRYGKSFFEIDWNDNFSRFSEGVATGHQIDFGTPDGYHTKWQTKPHFIYWANGNGWRYYNNKPPFERTPFDWSAEFHNLVGNWRGDGSNLIDVIVDGKLVSTSYMEYPQSTYTDPVDGKIKTVGMALIIGNQAVPAFSPGARTVKDNDGIHDGWTIVVQEISGWYGNIAGLDKLRASVENGVR